MDPNETLRLLREALAVAEAAAEGDSNDAEIEAWQEVGEYATYLVEWLDWGRR